MGGKKNPSYIRGNTVLLTCTLAKHSNNDFTGSVEWEINAHGEQYINIIICLTFQNQRIDRKIKKNVKFLCFFKENLDPADKVYLGF